MPAHDLIAFLPFMTLGAGIVVAMTLAAFARSHAVSLAASTVVLFVPRGEATGPVASLFASDGYARLYMGLVYGAAIATALVSYGYMKRSRVVREEYYIFIMTAALGASAIVSSAHFVSLFIGLELLSVSLYVLIAYPYAERNIEAGVKYLVLAATSASFLLFGIALIYASSGTMAFSGLAGRLGAGAAHVSPFFVAGVGLVILAVGFKLALVPFHLWAPDIFEGSPAPVAGLIATISKGAIVALAVRYFNALEVSRVRPLYVILAAIAIASMFGGNILALLQRNVKRLLAYSSISHMGYLLVAIVAGGEAGAATATFYIVAYFLSMLAAFGVITLLSGETGDLEEIDSYRGLAARYPALSIVLTLALLSLAGIPVTAGFIAKFYVVSTGAGRGLWMLLVALAINSAIGLFYYLRVIVAVFGRAREPVGVLEAPQSPLSPFGPSYTHAAGVAIAAITAALVYLGIEPGRLVAWLEALARGMR
jgi:NADH-quinone oxidoreductase subunit N